MTLIAMLVIGQGQVRLSIGTTYVHSDGDSCVQSHSCSLVCKRKAKNCQPKRRFSPFLSLGYEERNIGKEQYYTPWYILDFFFS